MIQVLDRMLKPLTIIDNDSPEGLSFSNDNQLYDLFSGSSTIDFDVDKTHEHSTYIAAGNYLLFQDERGKKFIFTILRAEQDGDIINVHCEDLGLNLLNGTTKAYEATQAQSIAYYIERELAGSGIVIGINEISNLKRKLKFESEDQTRLKRILSIINSFDNAEIDFTIDYRNGRIASQQLNIYKKRGSDKRLKQLIVGNHLKAIRKTVDITDLTTAIKGIGKDGLTFKNVVYEDDDFYTEFGSEHVYAKKANDKWRMYDVPNRSTDGYIPTSYSYETDNENELFNRCLTRLKTLCQPAFEYEAEMVEDDLDLNLGDYTTLIDYDFKPELFLEARVVQMNVSRTTDGSTVLFSNFKELQNELDKNLVSLQDKLKDSEYRVVIEASNGDIIKNGEGSIEYTANVYKGKVNVTPTFDKFNFYWTKILPDGSHDTEWEHNNSNIGNKIIISGSELIDFAKYNCTVKIHEFTYVSKSFFIDELIRHHARVMVYKEPNDILIDVITDTHYTADASFDTDVKMLSLDHLRNATELSNMRATDFVAHVGDVVDGNAPTKEQHQKDLRLAVKVLQDAGSPFGIAKGNHEDNHWGDKERAQNDMMNMINDKELHELITKPSEKFGIVQNNNDKSSYFYYDIVTKKVRLFILNSSDIPYKENADGSPEYDTLNAFAYREQQIKWFINALDTVPIGYQVIIFSHYNVPGSHNDGKLVINNDAIGKTITAYQTASTVTYSNTLKDFEVNVSHTFKRPGAIIMFVHGHFHRDNIMATGYNRTPSFGLGCSLARSSNLDRTLHTKNEDLISTFVIRDRERKIKLFRFGAGNDFEINF